MATTIIVEAEHCADIDIELGRCNQLDIDIELGPNEDVDIEVTVFRFGAGVPIMTARQYLTDYVAVPVTPATYTKPVDFDAIDGDIKYIVFLYTEDDNYESGLTMSYTDGVTTITPTTTVSAAESWFNTADGRAVMGYYIGDDIPRSGTIRIVRESWGKYQGYYRVFVGNAFGHVAMLEMDAHEDIAIWSTTPSNVVIPAGRYGISFAGAGGSVDIGAYYHMDSIFTAQHNSFSYNRHMAANAAALAGGVTGAEVWGMGGKGAGVRILLTDDANVSDQSALQAGDVVEFDVGVDHQTDMQIVVERGSCPEEQPET